VSGDGSRRGCREGWELELGRGRGTEWSEAPVASSKRRARGGEHEREMGGSARCGVEEGKREREGPGHGGRQHGVKDATDNGPQLLGMGCGAVAQTGESGSARETRRCATDMRGRVASGPGGRAGVRARDKSEAAWRWGADRWAQATQCQSTV
jgi:hypothetical protein